MASSPASRPAWRTHHHIKAGNDEASKQVLVQESQLATGSGLTPPSHPARIGEPWIARRHRTAISQRPVQGW
jgi:hypothetical protein